MPLRTVQTVRFVASTYKTFAALKNKALSPSDAGEALAAETGSMGPLYTKMAQFISARKDVLGNEFAEALAQVQDNVSIEQPVTPPALTGYDVDPIPIARASIADVFSATRHADGARVAIKQRRPGVRQSMEQDLPLLSTVMYMAAVVGVPGAVNIHEMIMQSRDMVMRELDFRLEAASSEEFRNTFADVRWLVVPRVVHVSENVLVTEFVESNKVDMVESPNPALAQRVMDLYMLMLGKGFVHADPHPGNLGFLPNGDVVLYDFGAMLRVHVGVREQVARALQAGLTKNPEELVAALEELGVVTIAAGQRAPVRQLVRRALNGNIHDELRDAPEFAAKNRRVVQFGTTFIYLTRTLTLIDGLCRVLDPKFAYDFSKWVATPNGMDVALNTLRDAASLPSVLTTMQSDMEDFQVRVMREMDMLQRVLVGLLGAMVAYIMHAMI